MLQMLKRLCGVAVLGLGAQYASAFALLGPLGSEPYQVIVIGYELPGDIGTPKNLGEEYRRNTPTMYFSMDANFLDYFGSNGVVAIEQAMDVVNGLFDGRHNGVTNISGYSSDLSEWPLEAQRVNYRAQALGLWDIKSVVLGLMAEQMGLAEPDRYTWTLHDRLVGPGGCPADVQYTVIKRNFDPVYSGLDVLQPSSYVNGTLYSYVIVEICQAPPDTLAEAVEFPVDPLANVFTPLASAATGSFIGGYYTGFTRDDMGGLRYLLRTNNLNIEAAGPDTFSFITNNNTFQLLFTSNLAVFAAQALTNDAGALTALYPDLVVSGTTPIFTNVVTTNAFAYFTNFPWAVAGSPASLVFATNYTTNVNVWFRHSFANVVTNTVYSQGQFTILQTNVQSCVWSPPGNLCTNVSLRNVLTNMVMGDFYIIPTNLCDFRIVSTQLVNVVAITNLDFVATNAIGATNGAGGTNELQFSQSTVTYATNRVFVVNPVTCPTNSVALRQGMERFKFVRQDFDSLLNRFFYPVTNEYVLNTITNNTLIPERVQRIITVPDFLMTAQDLASTPADGLIGPGFLARGIDFSTNGVNPGLAGPGTILPSIASSFTFNKVGPIFGNISPGSMDEASQIQFPIWGSFDGSTNAPIVYPNGTSVLNIEHQVLIQVYPPPPTLPAGRISNPYAVTFTASGGVSAPVVWSLSPGSPGLPPGLTLNQNGTMSGVLGSGTDATYDFSIRVTDSAGRFVDTPYEITITP